MMRNIFAVFISDMKVEHIFNIIKDIYNWWHDYFSAATIQIFYIIKYHKQTILLKKFENEKSDKNIFIIEIQIWEVSILNKLIITDNKENFKFIKIFQY